MRTCTLFFLVIFSVTSFPATPTIKEQSISVDGGQLKYYQIGQGRPVLLIHGLFANKKHWLNFIHALQTIKPKILSQFQFIIPDLPGYGASSGYPVNAYNLDENETGSLNQVQILHDFIKELKIKSPLSIAGNSMGGLIMILYAVHYPSEVKCIAFIGSPLGISDYTPELINSSFRRGFNPFIPENNEQLLEGDAFIPRRPAIKYTTTPFFAGLL